MRIGPKSQSGEQILAMFKIHQKLYRRHILHIFVPEKKDSCASNWSLPEEKWFNCTFIDMECNFGCITRVISGKLKSAIPDQS